MTKPQDGLHGPQRAAGRAGRGGGPEPDAPVMGYLTLRKIAGVLGMLLPVVLSLGGLLRFGLQGSMSAYCHAGTRDIFVGTLSCTAPADARCSPPSS